MFGLQALPVLCLHGYLAVAVCRNVRFAVKGCLIQVPVHPKSILQLLRLVCWFVCLYVHLVFCLFVYLLFLLVITYDTVQSQRAVMPMTQHCSLFSQWPNQEHIPTHDCYVGMLLKEAENSCSIRDLKHFKPQWKSNTTALSEKDCCKPTAILHSCTRCNNSCICCKSIENYVQIMYNTHVHLISSAWWLATQVVKDVGIRKVKQVTNFIRLKVHVKLRFPPIWLVKSNCKLRVRSVSLVERSGSHPSHSTVRL